MYRHGVARNGGLSPVQAVRERKGGGDAARGRPGGRARRGDLREGRGSLTRAQVAAARFNALAAAAAAAEAPAAAPVEASQGGLTAELERLAALHTSGALDDEEFRAAKARIIGG